jgi:hypothetical protein
MPTNTYVELRKETVATATSSVTLNLTGISGYTDLVVVASAKATNAANTSLGFQVNGDTGSNYSTTRIQGDGTNAVSERSQNQTSGNFSGSSFRVADSAGNFSPIIFNMMNYANTTTNKKFIARGNNAAAGVGATVSLWRNTAAITSLTIIPIAGQIDVGSTFSLYGISTVGDVTPKATGGTVYEDATYYYHAFPMSGRFVPLQSLSCDVLVVAGGGGGGAGGGGGGAGGLLGAASQSLSSGATYTVLTGAGGVAGVGQVIGGQGGTSSISGSGLTISTTGGGGGGTDTFPAAGVAGSGGSGGGGNGRQTPFQAGTGIAGQGNNGGNGLRISGNANEPGGGGGGRGAAGQAAYINGPGSGGIGATNTTYNFINAMGAATGSGELSGGNYYYAGGGAGGNWAGYQGTNPSGGLGGGATPPLGSGNGTSGLRSTGGGGSSNYSQTVGGAGGSGIVIVRYTKA